MINVVYPFGTGSPWDDRELLYSLRSVGKHLGGFRDVVVVGSVPRFNENRGPGVPFRHVLMDDRLDWGKQRNVGAKLARIVDDETISDEFLLMNDDFFLLCDQAAADFPFYRSGNLPSHIAWRSEELSPYLEALRSTERALRERGLPVLDFEIHGPIRYSKRVLREVLRAFDWQEPPGLLFRSLYCNWLRIPGSPHSDCKFEEPLGAAEMLRRLAGRDFFSVGDGGLSPELLRLLEERFPDPGLSSSN